jgi:2-dehydropantoate 2-reductase
LESLIRPLLHEGTAILTLQNGLGSEEELAGLFGQERILGGLAFVCINRVAPGQIHHSDYGLIKLGEFGRPPSPRAGQIVEMFKAASVPCELLSDLALGRWEKLIWNVPFNGLGGAMDWSTDVLMNSEHGRALVRAIMEEVVATARAAGVGLSPALVEDNLRRTGTMGPYRSSMQVDRQMHRSMEIEAIIGNPLRVARSRGAATPKIEMLYQLLKAGEGASKNTSG